MDDVLGYEGRNVVVTGAASGMGAAAARILVDLGAEVTAIDVKPIPVPVRSTLQVDLRDREAIDDAVAAITTPVHAVCSCAGLPGSPFSDLDVMVVNFLGTRHLVEAMVTRMPPGGAVTTIASTAGLGWQSDLQGWLMELITTPDFDAGRKWCESHPERIAHAYRPSKQAMNAWVCWRACTLIESGIRLNTLNPGPTDTPMMPAFERLAGGGEVIDRFTRPINRRSTPEEQAWALVVLTSPRLSYVNGHALFADGGFFGGVQTGQVDPGAMSAAVR